MRLLVLYFFLSAGLGVSAQFRISFQGNIQMNGAPLESAHVINLSSNQTTITNSKGQFTIPVDKGDILHITHVSAREQYYSIIQADLDEPFIDVDLKENFNTLGEVTIVEDNRITVQSVGIIQGKRVIPTANERRLVTAGDFKPVDLLSLIYAGSTPLAPILNTVNGRTEQIKKHIAVDKEITDYTNLYVYHNEFLEEKFGMNDDSIQQFLDSLIGLEETPRMAREDKLDKTRIWLVKRYHIYKEALKE